MLAAVGEVHDHGREGSAHRRAEVAVAQEHRRRGGVEPEEGVDHAIDLGHVKAELLERVERGGHRPLAHLQALAVTAGPAAQHDRAGHQAGAADVE
eukprot:scaffold136096_cov102-Phaeocystis_antarctica.AAC.2